MPHSYEEIRATTLDILANRIAFQYPIQRPPPNQYEGLRVAIVETFARREGRLPKNQSIVMYQEVQSDRDDNDILLEVFWDLFRQGIITLGSSAGSPAFPHFRLSRIGQQIIESKEVYFFHDVLSYEQAIRKEVPNSHDITLVYLKEAVQAFYSGCVLSCSVMLALAAEHTFLLLFEVIEKNRFHSPTYKDVAKQKSIIAKISKFRSILLEKDLEALPQEIAADLDTCLSGIISIIRETRTQSGHPTGTIVHREQAFVSLRLFIPYSKKLYQLMNHFAAR